MYTFSVLTIVAWMLAPPESPLEFRLVRSKLVTPYKDVSSYAMTAHEVIEYEVRNVSNHTLFFAGVSLHSSSSPERIIGSDYLRAPFSELAPGDRKRST
ncbi:MAG TPA: hypothetical protein VLE43_21695, partial [Candidatus Saccharimonadia bacterium]|nr:hypothetical protein [Candidatus Saccharimonadia bacterium]